MLKKLELPELNKVRHLLLPSVFIYIAIIFIMPRSGHPWDSTCWGIWATRMNSGLVEAYSAYSPVNYLPLYLYVLKFYGWLVGVDQIYKHLYLLKIFTLLFDIGSILFLCSLVRPESKRFKYFLYGLFNIGFFYNTLIWNQVDGILAFFVFTSFYFAMKERIMLSAFLFVLALNFKIQGIIALPVIGLLWLPHLKPKLLLKLVLMAVLTETIIVLPFLINGNAKNIFSIVTNAVDYYQYISLNAYNMWCLLLDGNLMKMPDNIPFIGPLTYKQVGLILFMSLSALVCLPLYIQTIRKMIQKQPVQPDMKSMLLAIALIISFFFFFNTQMHERYMHPLMIFSTALAFLYRYWSQWVIFSLAYTLNLEDICRYLKLPTYGTMIFHPDFIACLYGIGILILMNHWFRNKPFKMET
jgi:Gpi18-like mannosyltransferase